MNRQMLAKILVDHLAHPELRRSVFEIECNCGRLFVSSDQWAKHVVDAIAGDNHGEINLQ